MTGARRSLRRLARRVFALQALEPLGWQIRARRRERSRARDTRPKVPVYERLARIPTPVEVQELEEQLRHIAAADGPVAFAEWTGDREVELLYWIPFLTWAVQEIGIARERCTAIVPEGRARWYENVAARTSSDAPDAAATLPTSTIDTLCSDFWADEGPIVTVLRHLRFRRLPPVERTTPVSVLPDGGDQLEELAARGTRLDGQDLAALTEGIARSDLYVAAMHGLVHLGPLLGVPTVAVGGFDPSPHVDIAQRAAHGYGTPFAMIGPEVLPLALLLAGDAG